MRSNSGRVLVASELGVLSSDFEGRNLQRLPAFGTAIAVDPRNPRYLCATTSARQLYCSVDSGQSWSIIIFPGVNPRVNQVIADTKVEGGFYLATDQRLQYLRLASAGSVPDPSFPGMVRWMAINASGGKSAIWLTDGVSLYRSLDGGSRFERLGGSFSRFEVAPNAPNILYGQRSARLPGQPLLARSQDSGSTWQDIGVGFEPRFIRAIVIDPPFVFYRIYREL